jgi:hypothetical protein
MDDVFSGFKATEGTMSPANSFTHQDENVTIELDDAEIQSR